MTRRIHAVAVSLCLLALAAQPADALLLTGLETGYLTSWSTSDWTIADTATGMDALGGGLGDPVDGWHATQGSSFAYLMTQAVSPQSGMFSMRSEIFSVQPGHRLQFDTFFDAGELRISGRRAGARLIDAPVGADGVAGRSTSVYDRAAADLADFGADGWTHVSHDFTSAASYQLEFFITADQAGAPLDGKPANALGFDDISLDTPPSPVPEPGTVALLGSALALVGLIPRRRR